MKGIISKKDKMVKFDYSSKPEIRPHKPISRLVATAQKHVMSYFPSLRGLTGNLFAVTRFISQPQLLASSQLDKIHSNSLVDFL